MASDPNKVTMIVNGRRYTGWKSIDVTLTMESLAGSFRLNANDRWDGKTAPWPIVSEDACRIEIGDQTVIDGYVDTVDIDATETSRSLSYSGKDRSGALVECSMIVQGASATGHKWNYRNINIAGFATEAAKPHGIPISVQPGLVLKVDPLLVAHPGETAFEAIKRAAGPAAVLVVSDGKGGVIITRSGDARAASLVEGINIKRARLSDDATGRFRRYLLSSQVPGTDEASGEAVQIQAEATDEDVRRASRILLIRPEKGYSGADAKRRADWEARHRAANATKVIVTVQGWQQPNGTLWPVNALTRVTAPRMVGVDGEMLISQVEFSANDRDGRTAQIHLVRPDAFTPELQAVTSGESAWLVLRNGDFVEPGAKK